MAFHNNPRIVTEDLIGCWDANMKSSADSGAKLYDRVGSTDATLYNGNCLDFDGTDDDIYTTSDITLSGACTVAMWVYSEQSTQHIFSNRSGGPVNLRFGVDSSKMTYQYYVAPWKSMYSTSTFSQNTWVHIAWTRSSDNYISFFINGELDKRDQATNGSDVDTSTTVNGPVNIVGGYWSSSVFSGKMADFKVFSVELSSSQIKEMYKDSKVVVPRGIAHSEMDLWYPMSDGTGSVVFDGGGVAGSATNAGLGQNFNNDEFLTGQAGPPQLVTGFNRPMRFDSPQYVEIPQDSTLDVGTSDFTVSMWTWVETGEATNFFMQFAGAGGWRLLGGSGTAIRFSLFDNGWDNYVSRDWGSPTRDKWNHIAASVDRSGNAYLYLNGSLSYTQSVSSVTGTLTNAYPLRFGAGSYTNGSPTGDYTKGVLNEAIIYIGTVLDATDIAALAATGPNGGPLPPNPTSMTYNTAGYSSSNLRGYWRNDGKVKWTDLSGNDNHGTVNGSPSALLLRQGYNKGRDTQGFPLLYHNNGAVGLTQTSGSKINIPHASNILWNSTANFTIGVWYKHPSNPSGTYPSIWGKGGQSESGPGYELFLNPSGTSFTLRGTWDGGPTWGMTAAYSSAGSPRDGNWHYIVTVVDRDGDGACLYYDGAKQNTVDISGLGDTTNTVNLTLGSAGAGLFHGQIAGAQIYDRALNSTEIKQNYNTHKERFRQRQIGRGI